MSLTDAELVSGLRRRDRAALDEVYARYHARLFRFLVRLCRRRDVAEDLFQEAWVSVARNADRLAEDTDLSAWLFTVARNRYRSWRRWAVLDWTRLGQLAEMTQEVREPAGGDVEAREMMNRLERAMAELPPAHREVLLLVAVEGLSQQQVALVLGIRHDAVRQRLSRARSQLAARLDAGESPVANGGAQ